MRSVVVITAFLLIFAFLGYVSLSLKKEENFPIPTPTAIPTPLIEQEQEDVGQDATLILPSLTTTIPSPTLYEVREGDTLYQIALDHNLTLEQLVTANSSIDPNNLKIGQQILIPDP